VGDAGEIRQGQLFRVLDPGERPETEDAADPDWLLGGRTFGAANLHRLVRDIGQGQML
jgi:hypothetical protein